MVCIQFPVTDSILLHFENIIVIAILEMRVPLFLHDHTIKYILAYYYQLGERVAITIIYHLTTLLASFLQYSYYYYYYYSFFFFFFFIIIIIIII